MSDNRIIPADQVEVSHRGRKPDIDIALIETFAGLKEDQAVVLDKTYGKVPVEKRSTVSAKIRRHWALARDDKATIIYNSEGVPQVSKRKTLEFQSY